MKRRKSWLQLIWVIMVNLTQILYKPSSKFLFYYKYTNVIHSDYKDLN
jgi:hypothetical protein